jgi:hypothetical protein
MPLQEMSLVITQPKRIRSADSCKFELRPSRCRSITLTLDSFLSAKHSRAPLKITREMLARLMSYHQVMPRYLEFVFLFGRRCSPHDIRYSGFSSTILGAPITGQDVPELGRSGQQYQMCYNLKTIDCLSTPGTDLKLQEWSIRQAAMCHQFDVKYGTTLWMLTKGGLELKERIQDLTGKDGRIEDRSFATPENCFRSSLAVHASLAHWSVEGWRWYIQWLEDTVDQEVSSSFLRQWIRTSRSLLKRHKAQYMGLEYPANHGRNTPPQTSSVCRSGRRKPTKPR